MTDRQNQSTDAISDKGIKKEKQKKKPDSGKLNWLFVVTTYAVGSKFRLT